MAKKKAGIKRPPKKAKSVKTRAKSTKKRPRSVPPKKSPAKKKAASKKKQKQKPPARHLGPEKAKLQTAFLEVYRELGNITLSARMVGLSRRSIYDWNGDDWKTRFDDAREEAYDLLHGVARDRAVNGVIESETWENGALKSRRRRFSDMLLVILLKATGRSEYTEKAHITIEDDVNYDEIRALADEEMNDPDYIRWLQEKAKSQSGSDTGDLA